MVRKIASLVFLTALLILMGVGEDFSIDGILPGISVEAVGAQVAPLPYPPIGGQVSSPNAKTVYQGTSNAIVSNSVANYIALSGSSTAVAVAAVGDVESYLGQVQYFHNLFCQLTTAGGAPTVAGGTNYTVAFDDLTQSNTAITCTIGAAANSCSDTAHVFQTTSGDLAAFIDTPSGTPTALVVHCSIEGDTL